MPKIRIRKLPKGQFKPSFDSLGEEIRGTKKKFKRGGKTHAKSDNDQGYPFQRDQGYMYEQDMGGVIVPMHVPDMDGNMYENGGLYTQGLIGNITNPDYMKKGGWLKGAVNPAHKGFCTPLSNPKCTGHRRAFALTMKKHHGFHKKEEGGTIDEGPGPAYNFKNVSNPSHADSSFYKGSYNLASQMSPEEFRKEFLAPYLNANKNAKAMSTSPEYLQSLERNYNIASNAWQDAHSFAKSKKQREGGVIESFKSGGKYINAGPNTDLNPTTNSSIADYNPYVYFKDKNWYITSNPEDDKITESVKPVDRDVANIEAEKGEYILKPGLTGIHKVMGKTHAQGGTPLFAEGGSFIFSNDPKLAITKNERVGFGFKGDNNAKSKNTPAMIIGREVNPKEYNAYIATLENPDTDKIAKTTAGLMIEKLQQKLGQIAYLQESKKGSKPPDFSQGTAPVTQPEFQNIGEKMSEYRLGGYADGGPIDPRTGLPIDPNDAYPGGRTTLGKITPKGLSNTFNYPGGVPNLIKDWQGVGIDMTNMNSQEAQRAMYGWAQKNNPDLIKNIWNQYGNTAQGIKKGINPNDLNSGVNAYADGLLGARTFAPTPWPKLDIPKPNWPDIGPPPGPQAPQNTTPQPSNPGSQQPSNPSLPYQIKGKLTDSQIANLGYLGLQSMNINRYYPTRQQVSLPQVRLDQVNVQPYLNQINTQAHEAYGVASLNPRTSSLTASNIRGAALDQSNQAIGNVANQNVQIGNQQNLTNLQQMTNQVMTNSQLNNQYYNQVQATNQNFDNERRFANNQFMSTLNNYQSQQDKTAWALASVNKYGTRKVTDPKTGRTYDLPTPLYEQTNSGIKYNADVANLNMATGANRINTPQEIAQIYRQFKDSGMPDVEAQRIVSAIIRSRTTKGTESQGPFFMQNPYGSQQ